MQRCFISKLVLLILVCNSAGAASFTGLGDLPGGAFESKALAVSDDGNVVVGAGVSASGWEAFRWQGGVMTGLGDLPGGYFRSAANGVSADGTVVIGFSSSGAAPYNEAFRWQAGVLTGLGDLPGGNVYSNANAVSADGNIVVGTSISASGTEAFKWQGGVMTGLGDLPGGYVDGFARGVSADGNVVVGEGSSTSGGEAFRWQDGVMTGIGDLPGGLFGSGASSASADGSVVVGDGSGPSGREAFRWKAGVMTGLGDLPGGSFSSAAVSVSADGSVVVGLGTRGTNVSVNEAFIWTQANGMQRLIDVLAAQGATGLDGWVLRYASVSRDGYTIVGYGVNPAGQTEAFLAHLNVPVVSVSIDIEPWDEANTVRPASDNPITVAVHSTSVADGDAVDFDATQVDPATLKFGIGEAANVAITPWVQDLDGDSDSDVTFSFRTQDTGIVCDDTEATLTGETYATAAFTGTDSVTTTDCVDTGCHP